MDDRICEVIPAPRGEWRCTGEHWGGFCTVAYFPPDDEEEA